MHLNLRNKLVHLLESKYNKENHYKNEQTKTYDSGTNKNEYANNEEHIIDQVVRLF